MAQRLHLPNRGYLLLIASVTKHTFKFYRSFVWRGLERQRNGLMPQDFQQVILELLSGSCYRRFMYFGFVHPGIFMAG